MQKSTVTKSSAAFNEAYASLNAAQKKAVDTIEGPVMVIAGPGTGKTQILTLRIANILLKTDSKPENILALTFTESGATAMRTRLLKYIGTAAYRVPIFTFHGFAQSLISQYPDAYTRIIGGRPISDIETIESIQTIIDTAGIKHLRPLGDPSYYVTKIRGMIQTLKQEYITPDKLAEIVHRQETELLSIEKIHEKGAHKGKVRGEYQKKEKNIEKNRELQTVYRLYEAFLESKRLYDFDDMITKTIEALQNNEDMLRDLQEQYQYLLADEHQDVNGSQNKILELLASYHERPNIFVVGDEKQAIYRFQGASLENFLYFEDVYPHTEIISLTSNYRSGQTILDASQSLIAVDEGPAKALRAPLTAVAAPKAEVTERIFSHQFYEDSQVVAEIQTLLKTGVQPEEIAIIVRTNKEVESFTSLLRKEGLAVEASADGDILKHPITRSIEALLTALVESQSEEALFVVLHGAYWGINLNDFVRICGARNYGTSLQSIISDRQKLQELGVEDCDAILHVHTVLEKAREKIHTDAPHRVVEYVLQESGFLKHIMSHDALEGGRVVRRLYDELEKMVVSEHGASIYDVRKAFALRVEYNLPLSASYIPTHTHAVRVLTAHKSKGLEFAHVFIPHLTHALWGGGASRAYFDIPLMSHLKQDVFDDFDDERRLLYVGLTRAKMNVYLSYAQMSLDGRASIPSRLLEEIDAQFIKRVSVETSEEQSDPLASMLKNPSVTVDTELLKRFLIDKGLSATALNNYLSSPYDYLYRNVLRIPEVQAEAMQFGTVLHNTMEKITAFHTRERTLPSDTQVKEYLEWELAKMPFTSEEYVRLHEKGFSALLNYITHVGPSLPKQTKEEFKIHVHLETGIPDFPELLLTGKLDRLDFDEKGNVMRVIDYKSGKPKTRNEIAGNTKNSNGNYKRQLTFYALLLSLYGDARYACRTGVLSFVEADGKGNIHEEVFEITSEEIEALKKELIRVAQEIISGSFLEVACDPTVSEYCQLAHMLRR